MVRKERLELSQGITLLAPKTSASTYSATFALMNIIIVIRQQEKINPSPKQTSSEVLHGPYRDRTYDRLIKSQLLYQLS
jgi:hypothetical protein